MSKIDKWYIKNTISEDVAFMFSTNYVNTKANKSVEIKDRNTKYIYYFDKNKNINRIDRFKKEKTGELIIKSNNSFVLNNLKRNINYSMTTIIDK